MAEHYDSQVASLKNRKVEIDKLQVIDQDQAVMYQKKLHAFEKGYFDKLL